MRRLSGSHPVLVICAGVLLLLSVFAPMTVLCIGSRGHLAIEAALAHCCDSEDSHSKPSLSEGGCTENCTDTTLGISLPCRNPEAASPQTPLSALAGATLNPLPPPVALRVLAAGSTLPIATTPRDRHTTIQLC